MAIIKCKMCGGDLNLTEGQCVAQCEYCGSTQTVPTADNEKKLIQFERAERLRRNCEFDKAYGLYEAIISEFRQEAEAYWGLLLCKFGIEYVDDPGTGKKIPTCHRSSFDSVMDDPNLELVLENADVTARKVYREEAKRIEELRRQIISVSSKEQPYDIFICYKETDIWGDRTLDSVLAQDMYDTLTGKGYRVFFARISLEDKLGQAYEPYIFAALNSAKIMLAVGTDYEHFNAVWVKNEWSRFLKLAEKDPSKHLIPCFKGIDAYDMPREFTRLQAQDMGKVGAMQDLLRGIDKLMPRTVEPEKPKVDPRLSGPTIITNVCAISTRSYDEMWPKGQYSNVINYDQFNVICFHLSVAKNRLYGRRVIHLGYRIFNESGAMVMDEETELSWQDNYDRISKTWIVRGSDGTIVQTGKYKAVFWVDESRYYEYPFEVTSNELQWRLRTADMERQQAIERHKWEEAQRFEAAKHWRRSQGLCQYCGGGFQGMFTRTCVNCRRPKDY